MTGTPPPDGDPLAAVLDLLAEHAERLIRLDAQASGLAGATGRITEIAALARGMDERITALAARLDQIAPQDTADHSAAPGRPGTPRPSARWWSLAGPDRDAAVSDLRDWVDQVYRPGYGQLSASLGQCWEQHALCLYAMDILAGLWAVLYQGGPRTPALLSMQAEYQARILPALAEQMTTETTRCRHAHEHLTARARPRTQP